MPSNYTLNPLPGSVNFSPSLFTVNMLSGYTTTSVAIVYYSGSGDLDQDGYPEIIMGGWTYRGWDATGTPPLSMLHLFSTNAGGTTRVDALSFLGQGETAGAAMFRIADFTNDGLNDLLMIGHNESPFVPTESTLFVNTGSGFVAHDLPVGVTVHEGEIGDINGDGLLDIIGSSYFAETTFDPRFYHEESYHQLSTGNTAVVWINQGGGEFIALPFGWDRPLDQVALAPGPAVSWSSGSASTIADLDGDGNAEIIVIDQGNEAGWPLIRGDSWIFTDIEYDSTSIWGAPIALPAPYFEDNPQFADMLSQVADLSHDIQVDVFDFDNDGLQDILISSMIWSPDGSDPAGIIQLLRNMGDLQFEDVTDESLFNYFIGRQEGSHEFVLIDVNGDGFLDIVTPSGTRAEPHPHEWTNFSGEQWRSTENTWANDILINTGTGQFVSVMWDAFHQLTLAQEPFFDAVGASAEPYNVVDEGYRPYLLPDGRLGFIVHQTGWSAQGAADYFFDVRANDLIYTGPGGLNPALQGAAGFNEAFYLVTYSDAAAAVESGAYASGLAHYLAVGKGLGYFAFAPNARVVGSAGDDVIALREGRETGIGGDGADTISGFAGNDTLSGAAGNDTLNGGAGADTLNGGDGVDTASYVGSAAGVIVNLTTGIGSGGDAAGDTLSNVENIRGSALNDTLIGNAGANSLIGDAGADTLTGGAGADGISGGDGNDIINYNFGDGVDASINGGAGTDRIVTFGNAGGETLDAFWNGTSFTAFKGTTVVSVEEAIVDMGGGADWLRQFNSSVAVTINLALGAATGFISIANIENAWGSAQADTLTGSAVANILRGAGGDDQIDGGDGNDTLIGEDGLDTITGGLGADTIYGLSGADTVNGGDGDDTIYYSFGEGVDGIDGGDGVDTIICNGNSGAETLEVAWDGTSFTFFKGGAVTSIEQAQANMGVGGDWVRFTNSSVGVTIDLGANIASGFTSLLSVENAAGGGFDDTITGSGVANNLVGNAGADVINGAGGNDTINGGAGVDTIIGGAGSDTLIGGGDADTFVFATGSGVDSIADFDANPNGGQDLLDISGYGITTGDFGARVTIQDQGANTLITIDGTNTILLQGVTGDGNNVITQADFILA